jgi:tripartite-type tricarboxylate transporter receptor subunit TctC
MRMLTFRLFIAIACVAGVLDAAAQTGGYPVRPVRMIVPFAPGGASDFVARIIQPKLTEELGQQVVIDNRTGASGNIGVEIAAHAVPDGYTFLLGNIGAMTINPSIFPKFPVSTLRDFIPVTMVVDIPGAMAVHQSVPATTIKEFIDYAKARPGKLNYGSAGAGSAQRLAMEYFMHKAGIQLVHVPYKGGAGAATTALLAGEVSASMVTVASFVPFLKGGRVKVLGVMAPKRAPVLPDTPTLAESGFPELTIGSWQGVYVPARTPRPVVRRLYDATLKIMNDPWVIERLGSGGAVVITSKSPEEFAQFNKNQIEFWSKIVRQVGAASE